MNRLPVLAAGISAAHEACEQTANKSIEHAVKCGELLLEAKESVEHGDWLPWLEANCSVSPRTAQRYLRLARGPRNNTLSFSTSADRLLGSVGTLGVDLSGGVIGVRDDGLTVLIEPLGKPGKYVKYCHIAVLPGVEADVWRGTIEGIHEDEVVYWLQRAGVDVDAITWHQLAMPPQPNSRIDREALAS